MRRSFQLDPDLACLLATLAGILALGALGQRRERLTSPGAGFPRLSHCTDDARARR